MWGFSVTRRLTNVATKKAPKAKGTSSSNIANPFTALCLLFLIIFAAVTGLWTVGVVVYAITAGIYYTKGGGSSGKKGH
jgi:hypothetical protein